MNKLSTLGTLFCALWLVTTPAQADTTIKIPMSELQSRGVYPRNFSVYHLSNDGRTILAADEPPFTVKNQGVLNRLWLINLGPDYKVQNAKAFNLKIPTVEQANFTPDGQSVVLSSKRGSDIHKIDLASGEMTVLETHSAGQPGFRIHSDLFSSYGGKLYTIGYFYDEQDFSGPEQMVEINPSQSGVAAFRPVLDLDPILKQLKGLRISSTLVPNGLFFYLEEKGRGWTVQRWSPNSGLQKFDEGARVGGSWGEGPMALYCITRPGGSEELVLGNAQTGEKNVIHSGTQKLANPCLAKDGNTAVVAEELPGGTAANYWVAQDLDNYKMRKVAENHPLSTLRVSHDGQVVCLYSPRGLTLVKLEAPR